MTPRKLCARAILASTCRGGALPFTRTELGDIYSILLGPPSRNSPIRYS
jgi:hypothetical protein